MRYRYLQKFIMIAVAACMTAGLAGCAGKQAANKEDSPATENLQQTDDTQPKGGPDDTSLPEDGTQQQDSSEEGYDDPYADKEYEKIESDKKIKDYGSIVVVGNEGYELFTYRKDIAENYVKAVNSLTKQLEGEAVVYNMLVPLGSEITFPDNLRDQIKSSDQREAMLDIFSGISDQVKTVDIYDSLMSHRTEYVYYRTDHHWTELGAYYAYADFCRAKGIEPYEISSYETKDFDGFLGSFYNDTESKALKKAPDTIHAYLPHSDTKVHVTASDGTEYDWSIVHDVTDYADSMKYSTFAAGDNPMTVITNSDLDDGSSCVVVKESFGNALIPFLADHYQTIYEIDYRYWTGSVAGFAKEKGVDDVILVNNLSMTRNKYLVGQFQGVMKKAKKSSE